MTHGNCLVATCHSYISKMCHVIKQGASTLKVTNLI